MPRKERAVDELPTSARALLAELKDAHDPQDRDAQARVRKRVALAIGAAAGASLSHTALASAGTAQSGAKALLARMLGHKLITAAGVVSIGAAGAVTVPHILHRPAPATLQTSAPAGTRSARPREALERGPVPEAAPALLDVPASLPSEPAVAEVPASADLLGREHTANPAISPRKRTKAQAVGEDALPDALRAELTLIEAADLALQAGRAEASLPLLRAHAQQFPQGMLREERLGLDALARCTLGLPGARSGAAQFLAGFPRAVLGARIEAACKALDGGTTE
jgi:hypothetical protein